jgi:hypothetical protein
MKLRIFISLIVILIATSCEKKKYPPNEVIGDAEYYFSGMIDGTPLTLRAGHDNYYLYTSTETDANNLKRFKGDLRETDCSPCHDRVEIILNNNRRTTLAPPLDSSAVVAKPYDYITDAAQEVYSANFAAQGNHATAKIRWDFGDGSSGDQSSISHTYAKPGQYDVCLTLTSTKGCVSKVCNRISIGNNGFNAYVWSGVNGNTVLFDPTVTGGKTPYKYLWSFGDGGTSTQRSPSYTYKIAGSYPVVLTVRDSLNRATTVNYNIATGGDVSSCTTNFSLSVANYQNLNFSKVEVRYTGPDGITYSSIGQQPASSFQLLSVEDAGLNENGEPFKKIRVRFNCLLYNGGRVLNFDNVEGVFAVGYKQ